MRQKHVLLIGVGNMSTAYCVNYIQETFPNVMYVYKNIIKYLIGVCKCLEKYD